MSTSLPRLSADLVQAGELPTSGVVMPTAAMLALPERAIQFGTGAFLRGFVDYFLDVANAKGQFNGRVVAVGSTGSGRDRAFGEQDGLYTLVSRGLVSGTPQQEMRVIGSVSRALSAHDDWSAVLECAHNPELAVVFSNTTEVGIALDPTDTPDANPPQSFPGKLTRFLYERAVAFGFSDAHGLTVVPCELIERNGEMLRGIVLDLAGRWGYPPAFREWIERAVPFCNTLVDRIVPGAPAQADADALAARLGYRDELLTTAEHFRLFVIEGDADTRTRLGFTSADSGIVVAPDATPYRERKVRLLNGTHTISVSIALLAGCTTVRDAMTHPLVGTFIRRVLLDEIVPTIDSADAEQFAQAVLDRFENPHIRHALADITLHGTTKLRVRIVPTLLRAVEQIGRVPDGLALGVAAHLVHLRDSTGTATPADAAGDLVRDRWAVVNASNAAALRAFVDAVLSDSHLWGGDDLSVLPGFAAQVAAHVHSLHSAGAERTLESLLTARVS